jgi:hypothetical protein
MPELPSSKPHWTARLAKNATYVALVFFLFGSLLMPSLGGSVGGLGPALFSIWGVVVYGSLIALLSYSFGLKFIDRPNIFYLLCPALLLIAFLAFMHEREIIRGILHLEGVYR